MTAADFRRIALGMEGVEEYSHAGLPAFRAGGRKFASLASQAAGYGNLMLTLEQLHALTGSIVLAVLGQGVLFGLMHSYQGWKQVVVISALEVLYGALAAWRRKRARKHHRSRLV